MVKIRTFVLPLLCFALLCGSAFGYNQAVEDARYQAHDAWCGADSAGTGFAMEEMALYELKNSIETKCQELEGAWGTCPLCVQRKALVLSNCNASTNGPEKDANDCGWEASIRWPDAESVLQIGEDLYAMDPDGNWSISWFVEATTRFRSINAWLTMGIGYLMDAQVLLMEADVVLDQILECEDCQTGGPPL